MKTILPFIQKLIKFILLLLFVLSVQAYSQENATPVLSGIESSDLLFVENEGPKNITDNIIITDDDINMVSATVKITDNYQNGQDVLSFVSTENISSDWNADDSVLTLNGSAGIDEYITALRNVDYHNTSDNPSVLTRTIAFIVSDGNASSNEVSRNITVTAVNDAPVIIEGLTVDVSCDEDNAPSAFSLTLNATDADGDNITWSVSTAAFHGTAGASGSGTSKAISYTPSANYSGPDSFGITVSDGNGGTDNITVNVTVSPVNDPPVITGQIPLSTQEDVAITLLPANFTITDVDNAGPFTLTVNSGTNYTFAETLVTPALNYSGQLTVLVTAIDGDGAVSTVFDASVTVSPVNDPPVITGQTPLSTPEDVDITLLPANFTIADVDNAGPFSLTVYSGTNYTFAGTLVTPALNYSGQLTVPVTAADGGGAVSAVFDASVAVSPVNDPPVITGQTPLSTPEDIAIALLPANFTITDVDNAGPFSLTVYSGSNYTFTGTLVTPALNYSGQLTVSVTATDGGDAVSAVFSASVTVSPVNDPPVIAVPPAQSVAEEASLVFSTANGNAISISDSENDSQDVEITVADGIFTLSTTAHLDVTGNGTSHVTLSGNLSRVNTALNGASFKGNRNFYGITSLIISADDGNTGTDSKIISITVTNDNDAPVLDALETSPLIYTEGSIPVPITSAITVTDPDNTTLQSATVTISTGYRNGQDTLSYTAGNGITASWDASAGALTLEGDVSPEAYQTALRSVTYKNTSQNPETHTRSIMFKVNDGMAESNTQTRSITIIPVNNAPVLSYLETTALVYTENDIAIDITDYLLVNDADDLNLVSATVAITANYQNGQDTLIYNNASSLSIAGSWNAANGTLTLTGTATVATYRTALRNVSYRNTSDNPSSLIRIASFNVSDGDSSSNTVSRNITVIPVNDVPLLSKIEQIPLPYNEGSGAVQITNTITVSDPDNINLRSANVAVITGYQKGQDILSCLPISGINIAWEPETGVLRLTGNVALATFQAALRNVRYENTSADPVVATRIVTFIVNDGTGNSIPVSRSITVGSVNNAPVLGNLETSPLLYTENEAARDITDNITITDSDDATMLSATVSITANLQSAEDVLAFTNTAEITGTWHAGIGVLNLAGPASISNYRIALQNVSYRNTSENPSVLTRSVSFTVFDGEAFSNVVSRPLTVIAVNDPPVATGVNIVRADNRIGTLHTGTFTYSDPETGGSSPGSHVYKWYRKLPNNTIIWIDSVSVITYTPVMKDGGDSVCFEVTPVDNLGLAGNPVRSTFRYVNAAPVAGNVHIYAPNLRVSQSIFGRFNFSDKENNPAGIHTYQWYRSSSPTGLGTLIASAVDSVYKLSVTDDNRYIRFVVTPSATAGSTPGVATSSVWIGPVGSSTPTAVISGSDTICRNGPRAKITVTLTGEASWTIRYRRFYSGSTEETTVRNIRTSPYIFEAPGNGTYTLLSVSDTNYTSGTVSGSAIIGYYPAVTAKLTGISQLCQDGSSTTPMTVDFTGIAPWTLTVRRNTQDITYSDITQDPFVFNITNPGTYKIINLHDKFCIGDTVAGFGTVVINYITSPKASISGTDTICPGDSATLQVRFEGTAPFSITYLRNGTNAKTVSNIKQLNYTLKVSVDGTYTLSAVSDKIRSGCVSGSGIVISRTIPTASISGSATVCEYVPADLRITLTGRPPWSFSYRRNSETPVVVSPVASSPNYLSVTKAGTYKLVNVTDKYCNGTVSGSAQIAVTPAPVVTITGLKPAYSADLNMVPVFGNPDGGTFLPPVIEINDTNYFFPKWAGPGMHAIIYTYRNPATGCTGYDTAYVAVLTANADIIFPDNDTKKFFCFSDPDFIIQGRNTANVIGTFSISRGTGLADNGDNTATISPSKLTGGTYTVTYRYYSGATLEVTESFELEYVGDISILDFDESSYCQSSIHVRLNGSPNGGVFSGNAVYGNTGSGYYFKSELTEPGPDTVFYTYTAPKGCFRQVFKSLDIYDTPDMDFTVVDSCIYYGASDSTAFINLTSSDDPIRAWYWSFDDVESGVKNNSTLENPKHKYSKPGRRNVSLQATTSKNCTGKGSVTFYFEEKPSADFVWATECYQSGQTINLFNHSAVGKGEIAESMWKIYTGETYDIITTKDAEYRFDAPDDYDIELLVSTTFGCRDTIRKTLHLRPTYPLAEGATYFEGFESGMAGWISSSDTTVNSWILGKPDEAFGSSEDHAKAWFTHITAEWPYVEQSYVTSPCFNFSGIFKPMIKFDVRRLFKENRDGAVLQYTADSGKHWNSLGKLNDGVNWYNASDILGKPGGNVIGWSKIQDEEWLKARHILDRQKGKNYVQFRFAYGSDGTAKGTNGMAFDNVWIGERNKIALIEHFTSTGDMASRTADSTLDALANANPLDIIDIQYHTSFMGTDPFNELNPVDPRTRASLYQVSTTPVSILSGGTSGKYIFDYFNKLPDTVFIKNESLTDPSFSIDLRTNRLENSLTAVADIRPLKEVPGRRIALRMAVIERLVHGVTGDNGDTLFESVLKTLLPDTLFTEDWYPGLNIKTVSRTWNFSNVYNTNEIRVIAFLQDENTLEIYQAAIDKYDLHTAMDEESGISDASGLGFVLFPNPARNEVFIGFDEVLDKKAKADLYDMNGSLVLSCELFPGNKTYKIKLDDCTDGLFFMRITSENKFIGLQKMILSR